MTFNPQRPVRGVTPYLFLLLLAFLIVPAQAQNQTDYSVYDLGALPAQVALHMQIDEFSAGLLCSGVLLLMALIPTTIIARSKKSSWIPEIAVTLIFMGFEIGIGWLPIFFIVVLCFLIAMMFSSRVRTWVTGR